MKRRVEYWGIWIVGRGWRREPLPIRCHNRLSKVRTQMMRKKKMMIMRPTVMIQILRLRRWC